jgi:large subunit ribosomal protein L19e
MGGLTMQRKLAAKILKVGENKVWIDQSKLEEVKNAITRVDIKKTISHGYIKARPDKIKKPTLVVKKKKKGAGSRKGKSGARVSKKRGWIKTVRPLREMIKELRDSGKIEKSQYRKLYLRVKSGAFRSRSHLKLYLKQRGMVDENKS